jgi:RNA polymerase sigma-70 factor (ECF subfamily)
MTHGRDEDLVARFQAGDKAAFRELLERHQRIVQSRLAGRMPDRLRRRMSIADVVQEAALVAYDRREDFEDRGDGSFGRWLQGIAEYRLRDQIKRHLGTQKRSANREVTKAERPETAYHAALVGTPSAQAASEEQLQQIRAGLDQLTPDYRTVLSLALEKGLSLREVAEHMGRSREAVKKLYGRALIRLRACVHEGSAPPA